MVLCGCVVTGRLGATMNMVVPLPDDDPRALQVRAQVVANEDEDDLDPALRQQEDVGDEEIELKRCGRVRMLLQNFILIRILISRVLLSPWHCGICTKPNTARSSTVITNQRMLASVVYEILREVDPTLPHVVVISNNDDSSGGSTSKGTAETPAENTDGVAPDGTIVDIELGNAAVTLTAQEDTKAKRLAPSMGSGREGDIFGFGQLASVKQSKSYRQLKEVDQDQGGFERLGAFFYNMQAQVANVGIFAYNSLIERAINEFSGQSNHTEDALLGERQDYETISQTQRFLFSSDGSDINDLERIRKRFTVWAEELKSDLNMWLDKLTLHVLTTKRALRRGQLETESLNGDGEVVDGEDQDQ
mgnify:FL=1